MGMFAKASLSSVVGGLVDATLGSRLAKAPPVSKKAAFLILEVAEALTEVTDASLPLLSAATAAGVVTADIVIVLVIVSGIRASATCFSCLSGVWLALLDDLASSLSTDLLAVCEGIPATEEEDNEDEDDGTDATDDKEEDRRDEELPALSACTF